MKLNMKVFTVAVALSLLLLTLVRAQAVQPVTIETFVRAESDTAIRNLYNQSFRRPEKKPVERRTNIDSNSQDRSSISPGGFKAGGHH